MKIVPVREGIDYLINPASDYCKSKNADSIVVDDGGRYDQLGYGTIRSDQQESDQLGWDHPQGILFLQVI